MARDWQADLNVPPAPDDGWWAALMEEDVKRESTPTETRPVFFQPHSGQLSVSAGAPLADWDRARQFFERDEAMDLPVTGFNRGGLLVAFHSLQGFVPVSHLLDFPAAIDDLERKAWLAQRVGQRLHLKMIEHDPEKGRIVFSERAALAQTGSRNQLLNELQPGAVVEGEVTNICDFGVFVDLGGLEGLIHVSEVSWGRVSHPRDVISCHQRVKVSVLSIDRDQGRVALSMKRLRPDPWAMVDQRYAVGQSLTGVVTNVVNFGAFVCVEDGLEGLIHISELTDRVIEHPRDVVSVGQQVTVRVVAVDGANRRLALSLRQAVTATEPTPTSP